MTLAAAPNTRRLTKSAETLANERRITTPRKSGPTGPRNRTCLQSLYGAPTTAHKVQRRGGQKHVKIRSGEPIEPAAQFRVTLSRRADLARLITTTHQ